MVEEREAAFCAYPQHSPPCVGPDHTSFRSTRYFHFYYVLHFNVALPIDDKNVDRQVNIGCLPHKTLLSNCVLG